LAGETEVLGENLSQCHFVRHKPHMLCPDANPGRRGGKPATNRLSYGTANLIYVIILIIRYTAAQVVRMLNLFLMVVVIYYFTFLWGFLFE
jgi:hypothetical protein